MVDTCQSVLMVLCFHTVIITKADIRQMKFCILRGLKLDVSFTLTQQQETARRCAQAALTQKFAAFSFKSSSGTCAIHPVPVTSGQGSLVAMADWNYFYSCEPRTTDWRRTVVLVYWPTVVGQDIFITGGVQSSKRPGCAGATQAENDPCAIPIVHNASVVSPEYASWSSGDTLLDNWGGQASQGTFSTYPAKGTPLQWTTNDVNAMNYFSLNTYGQHYWALDVLMDCARSDEGWFQFNAVLYARYTGMVQTDENPALRPNCHSSTAGLPHYSSTQHLSACGFINIFQANADWCVIQDFPPA